MKFFLLLLAIKCEFLDNVSFNGDKKSSIK